MFGGKKIINNEGQIEKHDTGDFYNIQGKIMNVFKITTKEIYLTLIGKTWKKPSGVLKWEEVFTMLKCCEWDIWEDLFKLPYVFCRETKLQVLQYKLLNYTINCNENWHVI